MDENRPRLRHWLIAAALLFLLGLVLPVIALFF